MAARKWSRPSGTSRWLEDGEWYILDRNTNTGYVSYSMDADRIANLAAVFPLIFFLVAALISLTTMTRMVEEQRTQIGTLKALGYGKLDIASKYLNYALLATVGGCVLGVLFGKLNISFPGRIILFTGIDRWCADGGFAAERNR